MHSLAKNLSVHEDWWGVVHSLLMCRQGGSATGQLPHISLSEVRIRGLVGKAWYKLHGLQPWLSACRRHVGLGLELVNCGQSGDDQAGHARSRRRSVLVHTRRGAANHMHCKHPLLGQPQP